MTNQASERLPSEPGTCCPVMELALSRASGQRSGLSVASMFKRDGSESRKTIICEFRKARRGEEGPYGAKSEFAGSTYAPVEFCPFCGAKQS